MRRYSATLLPLLVLLSSACNSDDEPNPRETSNNEATKPHPIAPGDVGTRIADYMISHWPALDATPSDCTGPDNCFSLSFATVPAGPAPKFWEYTYGVPVYGVQKLFERTGDFNYLDYVKTYVDRYVNDDGKIDYSRPWPANPDGTALAPNDPTIQDVIQPSTLLFGLYRETKDDKYLKAMANTREVFTEIAKNPQGAFFHKPSYPNQQWLDGIYMSEPFLAHYGATYAPDSDACFETATTQIKLAAEHTFDPETTWPSQSARGRASRRRSRTTAMRCESQARSSA